MENTTKRETKPSQFLAITLILQFLLLFVTFFNIPVARQIIGFLYLTFIPGFVVLKLLKLDTLCTVEKFLFSVGLSVSLLMVIGLAVNTIGPLVGIQRPLEFTPLILVISGFVLIGTVVHHRINTEMRSNAIDTKALLKSWLLIIPTVLSIVGAIWATITGDSSILLLMIIVVALLFALSVLSKRLIPSKYYVLIIFLIALALLFHSALISRYIVPFGSDVSGEYFLFKITQNNAYWNSTLPSSWSIKLGSYNDMLSITILPTVYANILSINSAWVFKMLYPLIFSFVPLGLYQIWQTYIGKKYAFISAFLFMAPLTFYTEMLGLNRQIIAELFFVLLLLVILSRKLKPVNKILCFMIFSFALVTSHYALSVVFLLFISFTLVSLTVLKRLSRNISVPMVVFFFAAMFAWYIFTSGAATFDSFVSVGDYIYRELGNFLNPASRGQTVLTGLGLTESPSIWNTISRFFAYLTQAFIVLGFIALVTKRMRMHIEKEYFIFSSVAMAFLLALIVVPGLAETLNMTRFYHILLFFLAPLFVIGVAFIIKLLSKRERKLAVSALVLIILVPYFLFQTNFVYEVTGSDSWSIPLSGYRMSVLRLYGTSGYTDTYSVYGAQWLSKNVDFTDSKLYADVRTASNVLTIYGPIIKDKISLTNATKVVNNGFVYLSTLNVVYDIIPFGETSWNSSDLSFSYDDLNTVYTNGKSIVFQNKQ